MCDSILTLKRKYSDPYIILGGDFNKRNIREAINYYKDIKVVKTPPTRAGSVLDIIATNLADCEIDSGVGPPITSGDGTASDHGVVFSSFRMPRVPQYKISSYTYYRKNEEGLDRFDKWLTAQDWGNVLGACSPTSKVIQLHGLLSDGMKASFESKSSCRKSSEPSWISREVRDLIRRRGAVFKREGCSSNWWRLKKKTLHIIKGRKEK